MLHKEFAIAPAQVNDFRDFKLLDARFGYEKGAVISSFPNKWLRSISENLNAEDDHRRPDNLTEQLSRFKEKALVRFGREYTGEKWVDAAVSSHGLKCFHRVIDESINEPPTFVGSIYDLTDQDFYLTPEIERTAQALAGVSELLLRNAEKVSIVDPYFCLSSKGYKSTLQSLMELCEKPNVTFCLFAEEKGKADWESCRKPAIEQFAREMPKNVCLKWFSIDDKGSGLLHQRSIYTVKGGIIYDRGFKEPGAWDQKETPAAIALMSVPQLEVNSKRFNEAHFPDELELKQSYCSD